MASSSEVLNVADGSGDGVVIKTDENGQALEVSSCNVSNPKLCHNFFVLGASQLREKAGSSKNAQEQPRLSGIHDRR